MRYKLKAYRWGQHKTNYSAESILILLEDDAGNGNYFSSWIQPM